MICMNKNKEKIHKLIVELIKAKHERDSLMEYSRLVLRNGKTQPRNHWWFEELEKVCKQIRRTRVKDRKILEEKMKREKYQRLLAQGCGRI